MTNKSTSPVKLVLCDSEGIGRICVGLEPFFEFSFSIAEDLQDLVAQHAQWRRPRPPRPSPDVRQRR